MPINVTNDPIATSIARTYTRQVTAAGPAAANAYAAAARQAGARQRSDSVTLSSTMQEAQRIRAVASDQPDVRADRVAALRLAISNGSYKVDNGALAAKLMG